jgi:hypothetical protein
MFISLAKACGMVRTTELAFGTFKDGISDSEVSFGHQFHKIE